MLNNDIFQGQWKQLKGKVKQQWGNLTDNDLDKLKGSRDELEGLIQEKYGYNKERVKKEMDAFVKGTQE